MKSLQSGKKNHGNLNKKRMQVLATTKTRSNQKKKKKDCKFGLKLGNPQVQLTV